MHAAQSGTVATQQPRAATSLGRASKHAVPWLKGHRQVRLVFNNNGPINISWRHSRIRGVRQRCYAAPQAKVATTGAEQRSSSGGGADGVADARQEEGAADTSGAGSAPASAAGQWPGVGERESLKLLEWDKLCEQVACFTSTTMAAEQLLAACLPMGTSRQHSEQLLQQTQEAMEAKLSFKGAFDLTPAVGFTRAERVLSAVQLDAVATTLDAATALHAEVWGDAAGSSGGSGDPKDAPYPALAELVGDGLGGGLDRLSAAIHHCIQVGEARVLDRASERLGLLRSQRRSNSSELRSSTSQWAKALHAQGAAERPQVVIRRERLCVPVRQGRQGDLPKGSVTLAVSGTGSTVYMEPAPVVALNNAEALLAQQVEEEELEVRAKLSAMVATEGDRVLRVVRSLAALDVATARARHASWLGGVRPTFVDGAAAAAAGLEPTVHVRGALHPLLLQPSLPPPPQPPVLDGGAGTFADDFMGTVGLILPASSAGDGGSAPSSSSSSLMSSSTNQEQRQRSRSSATSSSPSSSSSTARGGARAAPPVPVDLVPPAGTRVVAVTGPNTGGKTASLKALGLAALAAKAGLFLAMTPAGQGSTPPSSASSGNQGGGDCEQQGPRIAWFDKVLADLGDGQSLQQNLSTFSGHVRRLVNILAEAGPGSLVLLDEVGSGTDPTEGAALATSILLQLGGRCSLTYATTHHGQLKEVADLEAGWVNASVEFDVASLRPTYRLLWGEAGASNALLVARGLNFDRAVVQEAQRVLDQGWLSRDAKSQAASLADSVQQQLDAAQRQAEEASALRTSLTQQAEMASSKLQELREQEKEVEAEASSVKEFASGVQQELDTVLSQLEAGDITPEEAEQQICAVEARVAGSRDAISMLIGMRSGGGVAVDGKQQLESSSGRAQAWVPQEGNQVVVLKMGGVTGEVVRASGRATGKVAVRIGKKRIEMRVQDLAPASSPSSAQLTTAALGRAAVGASSSTSTARNGSQRQQQQRGGQSIQAAMQDKYRAAASPHGQQQQQASGAARGKGGQQQQRSGGGGGGGSNGVSVQTSANTVDIRGCRADEGISRVDSAVLSSRTGNVLFVVHGVGTGKLRSAVLEFLRSHPMVESLQEEKESQGGCTIANLR